MYKMTKMKRGTIMTSIENTQINARIEQLSQLCASQTMPDELYTEHKVFRGLRDLNGNGVRAGITNICEVTAKKIVNGEEVPMEGKLYYRGIDVEEILPGFMKEKRFGFEETVYLLLFGALPNKTQLDEFREILHAYCTLPPQFTRDFIMKAPSSDLMNTLARSVLTLYAYDDNADDVSIPNVLRQCLQLIARFPLLAVYGYHAYLHYHEGKSLHIHNPDPSLSIAENLLHILHPDQHYTELEARILDAALVLHAEHGGGNNSTFSIRVVSSTATDTYSAVAAAAANPAAAASPRATRSAPPDTSAPPPGRYAAHDQRTDACPRPAADQAGRGRKTSSGRGWRPQSAESPARRASNTAHAAQHRI